MAGPETRRSFLGRGVGAAGAIVGLGSRGVEGGYVSRDAATGIRGEIIFPNIGLRLNRVVENWVDTFLLKDKLFIAQATAVFTTGRKGELRYDLRKNEDGNLSRRADDAGVGAPIVPFNDCYALLKRTASDALVVEVGLLENNGKRTAVLDFSYQCGPSLNR